MEKPIHLEHDFAAKSVRWSAILCQMSNAANTATAICACKSSKLSTPAKTVVIFNFNKKYLLFLWRGDDFTYTI